MTRMMRRKVIAGLILTAIGIAAWVFNVVSVKNALPVEGKWKGVIFQFHPAYPQQGLVIIIAGIIGTVVLLTGIVLLTMAIRERE